MNRIVLIGNGFDVAHGMKTKYHDFMHTFLSKGLCLGYDYGSFEFGPFVFSRIKKIGGLSAYEQRLNEMPSIEQMLMNTSLIHNVPNTGSRSLQNNIAIMKLHVNSDLLLQIISKFQSNRWVDIEREYYELLYKIVTSDSIGNKENLIDKLNNDMLFLRTELCAYLHDVVDQFDYNNIIDSSIHRDQMLRLLYPKSSTYDVDFDVQSELFFVNYNYTEIFQKFYVSDFEMNNYKISWIDIHGTINSDINCVIFGFGHIPDEYYQQIKEYYYTQAMQNIKLTKYPKNDAYQKFNSFISKGDYEVTVIGHSCGPSDGTTLRKLFDNKFCKGVQICHYSEANFDNKIMEITKRSLNEEVIENTLYNPDLFIPQAKFKKEFVSRYSPKRD